MRVRLVLVWAPPTLDEELAEWRDVRTESWHLSVRPVVGNRGTYWAWEVWPLPGLRPEAWGVSPTRLAAQVAAEEAVRRLGGV